MKKVYEKPQIEIEEFEVEDILTLLTLSSNSLGTGDDLGWGSIQ